MLILPGNVLITIPLIIFFLTKRTYSYNLINLSSVLFYISLLFLIIGLWLAIWSVRTFYNHGGDGTPGPWKPVSKLIIVGPYRYMRNPMLMGVFFLLLLLWCVFHVCYSYSFWFLICCLLQQVPRMGHEETLVHTWAAHKPRISRA